MCLAIPAQIVKINGVLATANIGGVSKDISLALVDEVSVGDYVLVHVGYALSRIDAEEAERTLEQFRYVAEQVGLAWPDATPGPQ